MIRSSIDLGTNTCLLLVADWDEKEKCVRRAIEDRATVVRLGQGVDRERRLHPDAIRRTLECLKKYSEAVLRAGGKTSDTVCVATSQARDAQNGQEFFACVEQETGFKFRVITGDQEAEFTFLGGLLPGMDPAKHAVIDIGGGSTELIARSGGKSLDIGSVRFTERYLKSNPVKDDEFWACQEAVDRELIGMKAWRKDLPADIRLLGVAGTATTLASWFLGLKEFDPARIDEVILSRGDIHRQVEELKWRTIAEREALTGIETGRADVLLAGSLILWRTMEILDFAEVQVSTRGLRYGVLHWGKPDNAL